ncbi:hypothetical protein Leryth_002797 [Lithospermum erythrorhizon]|nr:hypothetical protein Leryth_002797 [Lithospermum erythrorhizon]
MARPARTIKNRRIIAIIAPMLKRLLVVGAFWDCVVVGIVFVCEDRRCCKAFHINASLDLCREKMENIVSLEARKLLIPASFSLRSSVKTLKSAKSVFDKKEKISKFSYMVKETL